MISTRVLNRWTIRLVIEQREYLLFEQGIPDIKARSLRDF